MPFTKDRSGALLRLAIVELEKAYGGPLRVYITNVVKCNPRDDKGRNRKPTSAEVQNCSEYLQREIELVRPRIIVTLGQLAAEQVLGGKAIEWWAAVQGTHLVFPAKHPAYSVRGGGKERLSPTRYIQRLSSLVGLLHSPPEKL